MTTPTLTCEHCDSEIDTMREPTRDMLLAGHSANLCDNALEVWHAMIDEALK